MEMLALVLISLVVLLATVSPYGLLTILLHLLWGHGY